MGVSGPVRGFEAGWKVSNMVVSGSGRENQFMEPRNTSLCSMMKSGIFFRKNDCSFFYTQCGAWFVVGEYFARR